MSIVITPEELQEACLGMPLFPLPRVVLFPGVLLRLHVFEPRYVQLLTDIRKGNHMFAIPMLDLQNLEITEPQLYPIAGFGKVVHCEELPNQRYNIVVLGVGRIHIHEENSSDRLYRVAKGSLLREDAESFDILPLQQLLTQIIIKHPSLSGSLDALLKESFSTGTFLYMLAQLILPSAEDKQQFLSTESIHLQGELLSDRLADLLLYDQN